MENRFNNLTSKEWLPFQKSWFRWYDQTRLYSENIRFFTKREKNNESIFYYGHAVELFHEIASHNNLNAVSKIENDSIIQYALFDLTDKISGDTTINEYNTVKDEIINTIKLVAECLSYRRFLTVFIPNIECGESYLPVAWDLAIQISSVLSLKDEKIACRENSGTVQKTEIFRTDNSVFYCLYFRKDDESDKYENRAVSLNNNHKQLLSPLSFPDVTPKWFILRPKQRQKDEILHPAKFPEELAEYCIRHFTREGENVFDPMSGTGSTQIAAINCKRNGYGTELSSFFAGIANKRCSEHQPFGTNCTYKIICADARTIAKTDFPEMDYILTSPPYWDMLNMRGAENQAKRLKNRLRTNYSDSERDLGNIDDYNRFTNELSSIYEGLIEMLKPGRYMTIVVKNIKKHGRNYPLAWDLARILQKHLILLPEFFWCQDDISIAPYGYGNTWVSNTFHQYCLNFQKPYLV